jgi:erythromycin esterase-like protein/predicted phosphoribosyltransferase
MVERLFRNRRDAGRVLARLLEEYGDRPGVVVLGLPRGGVPVAYEIATALGALLDVFLVRKLGVPGREELAMGAIASGGAVVVNEDVVRGLDIGPEVLQWVAEQEARELLRRERAYRDGRPPLDLRGKTIILVDDGLATGASMRAAIQALRRYRPGRIVVAVPAAPEPTRQELTAMVDDLVCATTPSPFFAVGASYWDFTQTTDEEVRDLLRAAQSTRPAAPPAAPTEGQLIRTDALPVSEGVPSDAALFDLVGDAHYVLIGEASHGTHDFYQARAAMTRRLIEDKGFCAVAVEGDWPDAYRVNRYVRGRSDDQTAEEALRGFERFPTWMWRNAVVLDFVGWLRQHNDPEHLAAAKVGFYGLDVYSLYRSMEEVIKYLEAVDPEAAARARERYSCFDQYAGEDLRSYGYAAAFGAGETCEQQIVDQLATLQRNGLHYARHHGLLAEDDQFYAEQNARVVKAAAEYYRSMFHGRVSSWNLRDRHMADTLDALSDHLGNQRGEPAKVVVWEHNSHLGDARATESGMRGELNVGQLVRERHPGDCRSIGFTTYTGTVTAADDWGAPVQRKGVRPALAESVEDLFHDAGEKAFLLSFSTAPHAADVLSSARLERAIGVIYRPQTERQSHYFTARVSDQFDAVIHLDETRALEPLERTARWEQGEPPETYPFAVYPIPSSHPTGALGARRQT